MEKKKILIIGTSSTAIHVYKFIQEYNLFNVIGFAVDREYIDCDYFLSLPVYPLDEIDKIIDKENDLIFIAMLWNRLNSDRESLYERFNSQGYHFANIISPTAKIRGTLSGYNCWIHDYVIIQNDTIIGENVALMAFTLIGAQCKIGAHCFFGTKSTIGGESVIGKQSFVGINATVFDGVKIGNKCIIGACVAVKRNLKDYSICKTASDNTVVKQYREDEIESKLMFKKNVRE